MYQDSQRIARGAFAQEFTSNAPTFCPDAPDLAVKATDLPSVGNNAISQVCALQMNAPLNFLALS